jgi:hypothetical protein
VYAEFAANPLPLTVTVSPTTPCDSESETLGPTESELDAEFDPSKATTAWAPWEAEGTENWQVNAPLELTGALHSAPRAPENDTVASEPAAKPLPVAVTALPTVGPDTESSRFGVIVNVARALFAPWLAVTWCRPEEPAAMTSGQENVPSRDVVAVQRVVPEGESVRVTSELAAKPEPLAERLAPTMPLTEEREIDGVTVNVALATSGLAPPSFAVMVWVPATAVGAAKLQAKTPAEEVVTMALEHGRSSLPQYNEMGELLRKPVPVTATEVPTDPVAVYRVSEGDNSGGPVLTAGAMCAPPACSGPPSRMGRPMDEPTTARNVDETRAIRINQIARLWKLPFRVFGADSIWMALDPLVGTW